MEMTSERYNFSLCKTILVSRLGEGKVKEAATLLRDILAKELDDKATWSSNAKSHSRAIFERNHSVLRAAIENDLFEEATEIARLMVARCMLLSSFAVSQICQASMQFANWKYDGMTVE